MGVKGKSALKSLLSKDLTAPTAESPLPLDSKMQCYMLQDPTGSPEGPYTRYTVSLLLG